jgi:CheY-like chemotaxis protein
MSEAVQPVERDKANILIVDDLPEKLLVFETILQELGQNLVMVRSGSEALAEVLQREFAVILLDVNMPDIDGLETAEYLRRYKKSAHTPIIFITAYADEMQTAKGYSLGAVDYILSPIQPDILRSNRPASLPKSASRSSAPKPGARPRRMRTGSRTSSSRCSPMSYAIRSRPSAPRWKSYAEWRRAIRRLPLQAI